MMIRQRKGGADVDYCPKFNPFSRRAGPENVSFTQQM